MAAHHSMDMAKKKVGQGGSQKETPPIFTFQAN